MRDKRLKGLIKDIKAEFNVSLKGTFLDDIDDPTPILRSMTNTAMNWDHKNYDCWVIGKKLQREHRGKIPFKTELEVSAGLWYLIHTGKV